MNFVEKKIAYDELFGASHIEADKQLLQKLAPQHKVLKIGIYEVNRYAADLLWALLDVASREDVVQNRRAVVALKVDDEGDVEPKEETPIESGDDEGDVEPKEETSTEGDVIKKKGSKSKSTPK